MKVNVETSCGLPDEKYNAGWSFDAFPVFRIVWVTEDKGESIDGFRFNDYEAFLLVDVAWLFWSASFFLVRR